MPRSLRAYLWDIEQAASDIITFTGGKQLGEYENDTMLRAAVERKFEVIGEALRPSAALLPRCGGRVTNSQQIIAFRNCLIHGYATVRHALLWDIVQANLPQLRQEISQLLREADEQEK